MDTRRRLDVERWDAWVEMVKAVPAEQFDYRYSTSRDGCGCLCAHGLTEQEVFPRGLDRREVEYLIGYGAVEFGRPYPKIAEIDPEAVAFVQMTSEQAVGEVGLAEAFRRVAVVRARYDADGYAKEWV